MTLLEVSEKEEGVVTIHLPTGPLKTCSGLGPVLRCEPSTYQCCKSVNSKFLKSKIYLHGRAFTHGVMGHWIGPS